MPSYTKLTLVSPPPPQSPDIRTNYAAHYESTNLQFRTRRQLISLRDDVPTQHSTLARPTPWRPLRSRHPPFQQVNARCAPVDVHRGSLDSSMVARPSHVRAHDT
jgi:hypothetical protein